MNIRLFDGMCVQYRYVKVFYSGNIAGVAYCIISVAKITDNVNTAQKCVLYPVKKYKSKKKSVSVSSFLWA
jgi:hypothetical protein